MLLIEIIIFLAITITLSNVLAKVLPTVPMFMIQIVLGILLGLTEIGRSINFQPEVFLVMIIAPLLFHEGETADIPAILEHYGAIIFLAFGGVILTLFSIGLVTHQLLPTLPLAACLAFGAALGPTDAVAVKSLAQRLRMPGAVMHILEGEGLLNDASGVTAFQFAVAALVTGQFSAADASFSLLTSTLGGVLAGVIVVYVKRQLVQLIERISAKDITGYLLIELTLPFLAYLAAELLHSSGIIAAVVCGVLESRGFRKITLFDAELSNVKETTWQTISFTLNALVFLFLGIELSQVFSPIWNSRTYSNVHLFLIIGVLTALLFIIRYLFITLFYLITKGFKLTRQYFRERLILTVGGVKGTVSIATIFILPTTINGMDFPERSLLLFMTACVTFLSLIVGMILLPLLADGEKEVAPNFRQAQIYQQVIETLRNGIETEQLSEKEIFATQAVITNYQERIQELYTETMSKSVQQEFQEIQALIISVERDGLDESYRRQLIDQEGYRMYYRFVARFQQTVSRQILSFIGFWLIFVRRFLRVVFHPLLFWKRRRFNQRTGLFDRQDLSMVKKVFLRNSQTVLSSLDNLRDVYDEELIDFFIAERENLMDQVKKRGLIGTLFIQQDPMYTKELLRGYYLERKVIDEYESTEEISTFEANNYRHRVNLLESYTMRQPSDPPLRFIAKKNKK
ncbi:sodium:proton antiporter [Enterococcus florum]|uniref:Sodium:proton antiporter n=1 Tax=Enterococcus florum TaxID=2480627 RepID=A0A4P5P963_9ENTE|nr:sodium:proton antiporter [Enterococcus florum]GCF92761.1 sodium:proton antiporter [Enterococcus florum]